MSHQKLLTKLEGFRARNSINHCYINKDVYRLLYDRDFYYIAYNSIKSNDGAETAGSDGTSLHGFCEEWIDDLISSFRDESYQPQPNRITYIPKKNGKMRKLSFPNGKDKLVQECIRIILECIYEPTFSNLSHGFRPNRSVHSALAQVETWRSTVWFIEGDISACFDEIDHRILESILRERIDDERFIRLINKLLKAGYFDMEHNFQTTKRGNAQGSCASPILANIYLDKLDRFMENIIQRDTKGKYRKQNPKYAKLRYQLNKAISVHDIKEIKRLRKELKATSSVDVFDPNFRRVHYVRYADDFLVGTISSKAYAEQLKQEIKHFLESELHLRLSEEKTLITHAKNEKAHFLGYLINRRFPYIDILIDNQKLIHKLRDNGMCNAFGYPASIKRLLCKPTEDIITYGNQVLRGLVNNNQGCRNYYDMHRIQYIIQYSIAYTIARKCDISLKKVFKKYHSQLIYSYTNDKGKDKTIKLALHSSFKRDKTFFSQWLSKIKQDVEYRYRDTNPLKRNCYICGNPQHHVMFHRRRISSLHMPYSHIIKEMIRINRRQICLCRECFIKVSQNLLEYNQIAKRKLT